MNEMQFPICAPRVKEHMLKPEYWIEQVEDAEGLILNKEEIDDLNEKTFKQMRFKGLEEALYDLEKFPLIITKEKLLNTMKAYSSKEIFPVEPRYDASANEISNKLLGSIKDRENTLNRLKAGDPIYMKGHVVMYLGKVRNNYYVIHSGAGYGMRNIDGSIRPVTVHGVFVMEVHQLLMSGGKKLFRSFYNRLRISIIYTSSSLSLFHYYI